MSGRLAWVALGAVVGVVVVRRTSRALHRVTPAGMGESLQEAGVRTQVAASSFAGSVARHAAEREAELRRALGLDAAAGA